MSRIMTVLQTNAVVGIGSQITEAINIEVGTELVGPTREFSSDDVKLAIVQFTKSMTSRADSLNKLYSVIEDSQHPEELFDAKSIGES